MFLYFILKVSLQQDHKDSLLPVKVLLFLLMSLTPVIVNFMLTWLGHRCPDTVGP